MTLRLLRRLAMGTAAIAIPGMIVTQIADDQSASIGFGLVAALAMGALIVATSVVGPPTTGTLDAMAAAVERDLDALVTGGSPEPELRELVRKSVELGRATQAHLGGSGSS